MTYMRSPSPDDLGDQLQASYREAVPFPHCVIDDFLEPAVYRGLVEAFPGPEADIWYRFASGKENKKLQSREHDVLPEPLRQFLTDANGSTFTRFLERLTGIEGLIPDPHLHGGGLHQTLPGGHLGVHVDYNYHSEWGLDRRLNVILYLNDDWNESWGGNLELWDAEMRERVQSIAPVGNRLVVFNTDERSWHGHPDPLRCPEGRTRKSIALYYYTNGRPESEKAEAHNTRFRARPGESFRYTVKEALRDWVPPALLKALRPRAAKGS